MNISQPLCRTSGEAKSLMYFGIKINDISTVPELRSRYHTSWPHTKLRYKLACQQLRPLHWGRSISVTKFSVRSRFTITRTEFGNCTRNIRFYVFRFHCGKLHCLWQPNCSHCCSCICSRPTHNPVIAVLWLNSIWLYDLQLKKCLSIPWVWL